MALWISIFLAVAAFVTSTISGILGMGGGMTLLGIMTMVLVEPLVVPLHGVVQFTSNITRTVAFIKHVNWKVFGYLIGPLLVGVAIAASVWSEDKLTWFKPFIGLFILAFLYYRRHKPKVRNLPHWIFAPVGLAVGFLTIFVGATGPFLSPFFLRDDMEKEEIVATKAVCQIGGHLLKIPTFLYHGFDYVPHLPLLGVLLACVIIGTLVGKKILGKINTGAFMVAFEVVLTLIALYLIGSFGWNLWIANAG